MAATFYAGFDAQNKFSFASLNHQVEIILILSNRCKYYVLTQIHNAPQKMHKNITVILQRLCCTNEWFILSKSKFNSA